MKSTSDSLAEDYKAISDALRGDPAAYRTLIEKYQDYIFDLCLRMTGNRQDAEDITQRTFIKAYENLSRFRIGGKFSNWSYTIALNMCRNDLRKKSLLRIISLGAFKSNEEDGGEPNIASTEPSAEAIVERKEAEDILANGARALPPKLKEVFVLRYRQDMAYEDIAEILGISIGNVKIRLHRMKMRLWKDLSGQERPV